MFKDINIGLFCEKTVIALQRNLKYLCHKITCPPLP